VHSGDSNRAGQGLSELILVRHGQASFGAASYDNLSDLGRQQVQVLCSHWQALGEQFDHVYAGDLQRQQQTAELLLPVVSDPQIKVQSGLNEYNGEPLLRLYLRDHARNEGYDVQQGALTKDRKLFQLVLEAASRHWIEGTLRAAGPDDADFEPWLDFKQRVHDTLTELMARHSRGSRVLLATSGGVIASAVQRALDLPDSRTVETNWMVLNSAVTRLVYGRGKVSLGSFNSVAHLETPAHQKLVTFR
jgi:broad specificity phosphatase PhoE